MHLSRSLRLVSRRAMVSRAMASSRMFSTVYTKEHEYLKADGDTYFMGISDFAQSELGDVVFVDLPEVGAEFSQVLFLFNQINAYVWIPASFL